MIILHPISLHLTFGAPHLDLAKPIHYDVLKTKHNKTKQLQERRDRESQIILLYLYHLNLKEKASYGRVPDYC